MLPNEDFQTIVFSLHVWANRDCILQKKSLNDNRSVQSQSHSRCTLFCALPLSPFDMVFVVAVAVVGLLFCSLRFILFHFVRLLVCTFLLFSQSLFFLSRLVVVALLENDK